MPAKAIIRRLLEDPFVRVCCECEKELGPIQVDPGQRKSHGFCMRHYVEKMRDIGFTDEEIQQRAAGIKDPFCPDLSKG